METLDLQHATLVGWSLGYPMSLAYVDLHSSERLAQLVLTEGSPKLINEQRWPYGFCDLTTGAATVAEITDGDYSGFVEGLVRSMYNDPEADPEFPTLLAEATNTDPASTAALLWDHLTQDWRDVLPRLQVPTLVLGGTNSHIADWHASEYTANVLPNAELALLEGAGHTLQGEQPQRYTAWLQEFLAGA